MKYEDTHTINSGIVKDTILAVAETKNKNIYVGGGLSLQFDLPERYHRTTADLDLTTKLYTTYPEFKDFIGKAFSHLAEAGYNLSFKKGRSTFDAYLERDKTKLMVQTQRRSKKNYEKAKRTLEREFAHLREKELPRGKINLISLEDFTARKVTRARSFMQNYNLKIPKQRDLGALIQDIEELKEDLDLSLMGLDPDEVAKRVANIRLYADIFDMKAVLNLLEDQIDEKYLTEATASFENNGTLKEKLDFLYSLV